MTPALIALALGAFAALHAASWGGFKDAPFEGFRWRSYARSLLLGAAVAGLVALWLPVTSPRSAVTLIGVTYALERLATEWWKSIVREDDQSAYTIPMRLGIRGRTIDDRRTRYLAGSVVALLVALSLLVMHLLQAVAPTAPTWLVVLTVGGAGGWATAVGGAWKDAPVEGFSGWKFLRSPLVATAWALPLSIVTHSWPALLLGAAGFAVASIETYKTFFTGGRAPGKFAGRPVRSTLPRLRRALATQNAAWWLVMSAAFAASILNPLSPLGALPVPTGPVTATLLSVAAGAVGLAGMVTVRGHSKRLLALDVTL
ncbi:hypothetical protein H5V45_20685 [Nocardioides sp. KIGAM211]|uniref:Uncharacterized protein n=1 Tax=Nocardioides luti TaxID=2761101 RepID=A0A7X0RK13_9ACTN|nr:hypothetical protein [Nocardioides luti]MBB6629746.1 hypothetical protein [Nocardioides luti]